MFEKTIIDKLFEANGIAKRTVASGLNNISLEQLNAFTLTVFERAFKPKSLPLTELTKLLSTHLYSDGTANLPKEWSDAILVRTKPSKAAYRFLHDSTTDYNADIFNYVVVLGARPFRTPVANYQRYTETVTFTLTTSMDLSTEHYETLTKGAIQAPLDSPIYKHIVKELATRDELPTGTESSINLAAYISRLTAIKTSIENLKG